jgi:hypothetical protein
VYCEDLSKQIRLIERPTHERCSVAQPAAVAWSLAARAQQFDRMRRVGVLEETAEDDKERNSQFAKFRGASPALVGWRVVQSTLSIALPLLIRVDTSDLQELVAHLPHCAMSAFGTKRTCLIATAMSGFGGKTDIRARQC